MVRPNVTTLFDYKFDTDITINGELWFIVDTNFSSKDYNLIFTKYPDLPHPILLDNNGNPEVDDKGELIRDYTDKEISEYNFNQSLYRMAAIIKLIVHNSDVADKTEDELVQVLKSLSNNVFTLLEDKVNYIIKTKFGLLQEHRQKLARQVLAFTDGEKLERDNQINEISKQREKLLKQQNDINDLIKKCSDENKIIEYRKEFSELEKQIQELRNLLVNDFEDGVKTDNGVTREYVLIDAYREYHFPYQVLKDALNNNLAKDDEITLDLILTHYQLKGESEKRAYDKINSKTKGSDPR